MGRQGAKVGAVVIGRNEGDRLVRALKAVAAEVDAVVYVDSGSRDGSVEKAGALGVHVVALTTGPYTAARGRQIGFEELMHVLPDCEFVQFLDGDCVIVPGWIDAAVGFMLAHPHMGCVSGRRREEYPEKSMYNRLIDVDWEAEPGPALYPGGDSLCRCEALRRVGGWNPLLIAGEDPELGFRFVEGHWEVHRLANEMTLHDVAMRGFGAYWKRAVRAGYCYAEVGLMHRHGAGGSWWKRVKSAVAYGLVLPLAAALFTLWGLFWVWAFVPVALIGLVYVRLFLVMVRSTLKKKRGVALALQYATLNTICKFAIAQGVARFFIGMWTGNKSGLIEYKRAQAGGASGVQASR